jgi:transposase InsO family protein
MGESLSARAQLRLSMIEFYYQIRDASVVSRSFHVSRKTFYKWLHLYEKSGKNVSSLENTTTAPHHRRESTLSTQSELRIKHLREKYVRLGKVKLQRLYQNEYGHLVSQSHIALTIRKYNLYYDPVAAKHLRLRKDKHRGAKKIHIHDINPHDYVTPEKPFFFTVDTIVLYMPYGMKRYILTAIEYEKKIAYARSYTSKSSLSTFDFLMRLSALVEGRITAILSDNGSEFAKYFDEACRRLQILHVYSRVHTPKDNPVCERFNRTLQEEFVETNEYFEPLLTDSNLVKANQHLTEWLVFYNFIRPHQSLDYCTPIEYYELQVQKQTPLPMYPTLTCT